MTVGPSLRPATKGVSVEKFYPRPNAGMGSWVFRAGHFMVGEHVSFLPAEIRDIGRLIKMYDVFLSAVQNYKKYY